MMVSVREKAISQIVESCLSMSQLATVQYAVVDVGQDMPAGGAMF
jgi:hypothetical protein